MRKIAFNDFRVATSEPARDIHSCSVLNFTQLWSLFSSHLLLARPLGETRSNETNVVGAVVSVFSPNTRVVVAVSHG